MKAKPKSQQAKFRNLYVRGGRIWYRRDVGGKEVRFSLGVDDWEEAAKARDLYEVRRGIGRLPVPILEVPTFAEMADRYLKEAAGHLAATTRYNLETHLRAADEKRKSKPEAGPLRAYFGAMRLDEIRRSTLVEWYHREVEGRGLVPKTGAGYLDSLASVFSYAIDLELLDVSPVDAFRGTLRRRARTKRGRAEAEASDTKHPVEPAAHLAKLVKATRKESRTAYAFVLLQLDAGLRQGEALGLRWGRIAWGVDADDEERHLVIDGNRPRGGAFDHTKSGRSRRVALSRRLRSVLRELYVASGQPDGDELVFPDLEPNNFRRRVWDRNILKRAKVGPVRMKDLRDSFACYLLTAGVELSYVAEQLGHSDVATTAQHYGRRVKERRYTRPMELRPGEVPADLLARFGAGKAAQNLKVAGDDSAGPAGTADGTNPAQTSEGA